MLRLTCLVAIGTVTFASSPLSGQTMSFTIAGDVERAVTWELDANPTVLLRDLLDHAGAGDQGNAVILHSSSPEQFFSEVVSPLMRGRGSRLSSGDIVIFHGRDNSQPASGNVVIIAGSDSVPRIVNLSPTGNTLGGLLTAIGAIYAPTARMQIVRTNYGSPSPMWLSAGDAIVHGDVLFFPPSVSLNPVRISRLFQTIAADPDSVDHVVKHVSTGALASPRSPRQIHRFD